MCIPVFLVIANFLLLTNSESVCKLPNTGSVLFRNIDMHRRNCWSREELALVYTRRAMMEIVPKQIPHNIPLILEYIQVCINTLRDVAPTPEVYDYMFATLADTFGGYLQTYGLPLLHEAYYEGYVSYDNAAEFHRLQDDFKEILMTNGEGWTKPMEVRKHINHVLPLKLPTAVGSKPCSLLLFSDPSCQKAAVDEMSANENQSSPLIPLPIIDDNKQPNSIAIPFKNHALYNLKSRNSYDILIKYYIESSRCLALTHANDMQQMEFDHIFSDWLKSKVLPHLKDEVWYVGFSNVLRIQETIQQKGGMIVAGQPREKEEDSLFTELESETQLTRAAYIAILLILLFSLLFICFLYWAFIKNCIMCCGKVDVESSRSAHGDEPSDNTSLLSASDEYSNPSSGKGQGRKCRHNQNRSDTSKSDPQSQSARTVSEESRLTLSCGLGKGFPSRCRKHHH